MAQMLYRRSFVSFIICFCVLVGSGRGFALSGEIQPIEIFGNVVGMPLKKSLEGVVVALYKGNFKVDEVKTDRKGRFAIFITPNTGEYQIRFSYPLHVGMFCVVNSSVPAKYTTIEKGHQFPDLPMWPSNTKDVNIYAYRDLPFAKIRWEQKSFGEDLSYFDIFRRKMDDLDEMAEIRKKELEEIALKEKQKKEKEEKERAEKELKEKELKEKELALKLQLLKEKEERERLEKEQQDKLVKQKKLEEEQKLLEKQLVKAKEDETVGEDVKLKQEKDLKEKIKKKNQAISAQYQNDLLVMVAENEKKMKQSQMMKKKAETDANAITEKLRKESELKAQLDELDKEIQILKKKKEDAKKEKILAESGIIKTAAQVEKIIKEQNAKGAGNVKDYSFPPPPVFVVEKSESMFSWITTVTITYNKQKTVLTREVFIWGTEYFYRNGEEIRSVEFIAEILKFKNIR
ncbi:MAG: hypothetical protein IT233_04075 [Bacteroidia bacterium]|nr:hypothetical protein [Bacteroidia bacterium]